MNRIVKYLIQHSRTAHYATGVKISRALLVWTWCSVFNLIGAHIEYAANGHSLLGWLLVANALAPWVDVCVLVWRQHDKLIED